jgi:hypothetical protein
MAMATDRDKIRVNITARVAQDAPDPATPIFNALNDEFTQFYADHVLARKVESDINGTKETDEPAKTVDDVDDSGRAPGSDGPLGE